MFKLASVVILAGGLSTRMGLPKAMLKLPNGETLLEYHIKAAQTLDVPIVIADNAQSFEIGSGIDTDNIRFVQDYHPARSSEKDNHATATTSAKSKYSVGPLGGIISSMMSYMETDNTSNTSNASLSNSWMMVISCDSLVTAQDVWQLIQSVYDKRGQKINTDSTDSIDNAKKDKQVICLTQEGQLYPLLGLYRLNLLNELKAYLDSGQRKVMTFIDPFLVAIKMPKQWHGLSNLNTLEDFNNAVNRIDFNE